MSPSSITDTLPFKETAAAAALDMIPADCLLGIGTGTTTDCLIRLLPQLRNKPELVVASSERSAALLTELGIKVSPLAEAAGDLDLYIDGADEFTRTFTLVKGGGGAHTHEKILAAAARKFIVIADPTKQVGMLGKFPIPVEVLSKARSLVARKIVARGGSPSLREGFVTDEGNQILDCTGMDCLDTSGLETRLASLPGVVDSGLCSLRPADMIIIGGQTAAEVEIITR